MNLPCEGCLVFPICKLQIKRMDPPDVTQFSMRKNCDPLQDFIRLSTPGEDHSITNRHEIAKARKFFNLCKVVPGSRSINENTM